MVFIVTFIYFYFRKPPYNIGYNTEQINEGSLVKDAIMPFLNNYFPNDPSFTTFGPDKEIFESKKRFTEIDPSLKKHVRKCDYSIVTNISKHLVFALESKSVPNQGKSKGDLLKMARYMKDTIDAIEDEGFESVPIVGMIASGLNWSCYVMEHKYDYLYTFYKIRNFFLPLNYHDIHRIIPIFGQ